MEKPLELTPFGRAEVRQHLLFGVFDSGLGPCQHRGTFSGELSRQCPAERGGSRTGDKADVLQPLQNLVHRLRGHVGVPGKLGAGAAWVVAQQAQAHELGQPQSKWP
jgi:hypothetical protein